MDDLVNPAGAKNICSCTSYPDLDLTFDALGKRIALFKMMRRELRQVAHLKGKRLWDRYRLYVCDSCGQHWQGTLATIVSADWPLLKDDEWYLFKVPPISAASWRKLQFVCPDTIIGYLKDKYAFMQNNFEVKDERCPVPDCGNKVMTGSIKCQAHHFEDLAATGLQRAQPTGRWFPPYSEALLGA